jgi:hypothetical protein
VVTTNNCHRGPRITQEARSLIVPCTEIVHGAAGRSGTQYRNRAGCRGLPLKISLRATKAAAGPTERLAARKRCWHPERKPCTKENYPRRLNPLRLLAALVTATDVTKVVTLLTNSPKQLNHEGNQQTARVNLGSKAGKGGNVRGDESFQLSRFALSRPGSKTRVGSPLWHRYGPKARSSLSGQPAVTPGHPIPGATPADREADWCRDCGYYAIASSAHILPTTPTALVRKAIQLQELIQHDGPSFPLSRRKGKPQSGNQHKKDTTTMIDQMTNEARDSIIYGYATGWAHLQAVADRVSMLACEGRLTDADRDRIHDHVREVFGGLDRLYGQGCDQLAVGCDEDGYYCRTYSDGSPVYSSASPAEQFRSPNAAVYCGDFGLADALEPGTEVMIH